MLHFAQDEFDRRLRATQAAMADAQIDVLLMFNPSSHFWLTGFDTFGYCFFQCLVLSAEGEMTLLTRSADLRQAEHTSIIKDIRVWRDAAGANPANDLSDLLTQRGYRNQRIGVEWDTHGLTAHNGRRLDEALEGCSLSDASTLVTQLRLIKSDAELAYVRRAGWLADQALDAAIQTTSAGADEGEILAAMHNAIFAQGGDYPGNPFIIGSGKDALLCRYKTGRRKLASKDQLTIEWAGVEKHYHAAGMRTLLAGEPSPQQIKMFEAAHAALEACEAALVPGRTFHDVFKAHSDTFDELGLTRHRLNACGYSLGTVFAPSWMDWPMFYEGNPVVIEPSMVLFLHMILMDSETGLAMCLGRTSLTTSGQAEALMHHPLQLIHS